MTTSIVPASEKILRRIQSEQGHIDRARRIDDRAEVENHTKVRRAYVADLIDVLNEEERLKPREERTSYSLASTEAWIEEHSKKLATQ
jgi:hypothetical protein